MGPGGESATSPGADAGAASPSTYSLSVAEVNVGSDVRTLSGSTESPSTEFGARIANRRLTVFVKDAAQNFSCEAAVTTADTNRVPGTFNTDSSFTDSAFVTLRLGNVEYDLQNSGRLAFDVCPRLGSLVTATLTAVRAGTSVGSSNKVVDGTVKVRVLADDGSLLCR